MNLALGLGTIFLSQRSLAFVSHYVCVRACVRVKQTCVSYSVSTVVVQVVSIQMVDRNVIHASRWLENRWLITVNCAAARLRLLRGNLSLLNKLVNVRAYDDVITEEYHEYQAGIGFVKSSAGNKCCFVMGGVI